MKREFSATQVIPEALVLIPLIPLWAVAMLSANGPVEPVAVVGAIAVCSALLFGRLLWRHAIATVTDTSEYRLVQYGIAIVGSAVLWVWLQYALNPFRMRGTLDALLVSRSAPWQLAAGIYLFGSVIVAAWLLRSRASRPVPPDDVVRAPFLAHLTIRVGDRTSLVDVESVERIQASDDHVAIHAGGRQLIASYRISELISQLDPKYFIRIHRSHVVNMSHVASIQRVDTNRDEVILKNGDRVTASRTGSVALRKRLVRRQ